MGKKHGRWIKAIPPSLPKTRVSTRDAACSPVPELLSEVSPSSHTESTINCDDVSRSALPKMKTVDLNRSEIQSAVGEFVASRVNGVVSVTAAPVEIDFSLANLGWKVIMEIGNNGKLSCHWRITKKIYANQWKVVASLGWRFFDVEDKKGLDCICGTKFDSDGFRWVWKEIPDSYWRPLVTIPENEDETISTVLDVNLVLTIWEMFGFRLRDKFSYDFTAPSKDCDLVFQFTDGDLYINCNFLSFHSDYFSATRDRLSQMKTDENGFPFEKMDVKMEEFAELMQIVYPSKRKVADENVSFIHILPLADRFLFEGVLRECEAFLMSESSETDIFLKLLWASEYTMSDLQDWCFAQFKTREEINKVQKFEHYKKLRKTGNIMTALYEKLAELEV